jgi:hypothetical protein
LSAVAGVLAGIARLIVFKKWRMSLLDADPLLGLSSLVYSEDMLGKVVVVSIVIAFGVLALLLSTTEPASIGPLGILLVFILMYVSVLGVLTFLLYGGSRMVSKIASSFTVRKPIGSLSLRRSYYFSSVLALAPVMIVGMQSVGGVGIYELLLIIIFELIACIYIAKRTR